MLPVDGMPLIRRSYHEARDKMLPGDVIAFSGRGLVSSLIKLGTRHPVSHVGIVFHSGTLSRKDRAYQVLLIEAILSGGVTISRLSEVVRTYPGQVWWLPLSAFVRESCDPLALMDTLLGLQDRRYDFWQALVAPLAAIVRPGSSWNARQALKRLFCSELVAQGLKAAGILPANLSIRAMTPAAVCRLSIYGENCYQLKGQTQAVPGWNTWYPEG